MDLDRTAICVDLDGTLLRTDLLYESALALLRISPLYLFALPWWLLRGKANLKRQVALRVNAAFVSTLPYDDRVLGLLRESSLHRVLCTASDELLAGPIAARLGVFDEVIASDGTHNRRGSSKADALVSRFGARGFHYVANQRVDLHVWKHARSAWVVNGSAALARSASRVTELAGHLPKVGGGVAAWGRALRVHQWLKNLLVFVPLLAAHAFTELSTLGQALLAFAAFSLCASGVYVLNDLLDLPVDRAHPRKRFRPFASGELSLAHGMVASPLLTAAGFLLAWLCSPAFFAVLAIYCVTTLAYSLHLKRVHMLDVMLLAGLYTIRIIAGGVAVGVPLSFWLLAFSMFLFLSLAMLKRYTELSALTPGKDDELHGRGYAGGDLPLLQSLGGSAGYLSVLVLALYINSPESLDLYSTPQALWFLCPLLLYWISRSWSLVRRGRMHDDPVVFAVTDRTSLAIAGLCGLVVIWAI